MALYFEQKKYSDSDIEQAALSVIKAICPIFGETDTFDFVSRVMNRAICLLSEETLFKFPYLIVKENP